MRVRVRLMIGAVALLSGVMSERARVGVLDSVNAQSLKKAPAVATQGGALPTPLPLFPSDNWWNLDISGAPVDGNSPNFIMFIGVNRTVHPDLGNIDPASPPDGIYGIPYVVVDSSQPKKTVQFLYSDESDGVDHNNNTSFPFYPIPDEAITQAHWIEGGQPGNQDPGGDRHMLIVDKDNKYLYELYSLLWDGTQWTAGSGAFYDMKTNNRRPEGWTSADAAGLAILPGLIRYDEVHGGGEIGHAFRVTVSSSSGHVYPASHTAGSAAGALPMGARLRLKPGAFITGASATPEMQRIVTAMKKYGLIVADNGSNMYVTGTYNPLWDNDPINEALGQLHASDFEVIQLGYNPPALPALSINDVTLPEGNSGTSLATFTVSLSAVSANTVTVNWATADGTATTANADYVANGGGLTFFPGDLSKQVSVTINGDLIFEPDETFFVNLSAPTNAVIARGQGVGTITNDDTPAPIVVTGAAGAITDSTAFLNGTVNPNGAATNGFYQYGLTAGYGSTTAATPLGSVVVAVALPIPVAGLTCNTLYHFRAVATNSGGTTNGLDNTFTTSTCPPPPTVTTMAATSIAQTGATLNGTVNPNTGVTNRRFEYGLTAGYGTPSPDLAIGNGSSALPVSFVVTGLACNTLYHFRAVGQNSGGTGNGGDLTFTTAACPATGSNNISASTARALALNSASRDSMSNVRAEIWFRVRLFAARSYQFSAWPVDHEQGVDAPGLDLSVFSDDAGTTPATPTPTISSALLEGSPNSNGDALPSSLVFQPTATGVYKVRILRSSGGTVTHSVTVAVRETTIFSPWTSKAAGFEGFIEMHNNTNAALSVTLRAYNSAGALQGAGITFSIPANATAFKTATDVGVPVNVFAGIVLTHNGAAGAMSANITTLNGANGLSFDSPFTPRSPATAGLPIR